MLSVWRRNTEEGEGFSGERGGRKRPCGNESRKALKFDFYSVLLFPLREKDNLH